MPPITFAITPRFDVFYALYAAMTNAPSPLDEWRRRAVDRLPADFEKRAQRIAPMPIFWPLLADSLQRVHGEIGFEDMLRTLDQTPLADVRFDVLSGIFHDPATVRSLVSGEKGLRQLVTGASPGVSDLLTHFGLRPYDSRSQSARTISLLVDDPETFRDELSTLLRQFWQSGFAEDWAELEPSLRLESVRMGRLHKDLPPGKFASQLGLPIALDDTAREVTSRGQPIPYDRIDNCFLMPSAFNTHRWWTKYESKTGRFTLYIPVIAKAAAASHGNIRAELVFRALGDTTRYAIASILARTPTSSAELARTLHVSKPTITHHVQTLRSAGLIRDTPSGGSTKLSLNRQTVGAVSGAALEQLFSSDRDLPLATTRKRRTTESR